MPTTAVKNMIYRLALPILAPYPDRKCLIKATGNLQTNQKKYKKIIRRHHVLGSICLLADQSRQVRLYTRSVSPSHDPLKQPVFRVASITKMATALLIMVCVDQNIMKLDDLFILHMPPEFSYSRDLEGVTLRHLLSHTSGIIDPPDLENSLLEEMNVLNVLNGRRKHIPGTCFHYSNLGFGLLGCLLESVFNQPLQNIFYEKLFFPLGSSATMDATELCENMIMPITRILPYHREQDIRITQLGLRPNLSPDPFLHYGHTAGSMYTDIDSLWKLVQCLIHNGSPLIKTELGMEMTKMQSEYGSLSPTLSYGLGVLRIKDDNISPSIILGHQGFAYGCADGAFWEENTGKTVIFLNGGCSEARIGRLGLCNRDLLRWAFREEFLKWK